MLWFGDVIFSELECVGVEQFLRFSRRTARICTNSFVQGLENTCSLSYNLHWKTLHRVFNNVDEKKLINQTVCKLN